MTLQPSADPKDFPVFGNMGEAIRGAKTADLLQPLCSYATRELSFEWVDIKQNEGLIKKIVDMVQRRQVYFHVFHDMEMGELNEACLFCFWILKLCPFYYVKDPNYNINVTLALAMFTRAITYEAKKRGGKPNFTKGVVEHLVHAFTYRDLSKEAIMAIAKSLAG
jgi:hypothetical protein